MKLTTANLKQDAAFRDLQLHGCAEKCAEGVFVRSNIGAATELLVQAHHSGRERDVSTAAKCPQQAVVCDYIWLQAQLWHLVLKYVQCCLQAEGQCVYIVRASANLSEVPAASKVPQDSCRADNMITCGDLAAASACSMGE